MPDLTLTDLIRPAKPAMIWSATLTAFGAVIGILPYIALVEISRSLLAQDYSHATTWVIIASAAVAIHGISYGLGLKVSHVAEAKLRHQLRESLVAKLGRVSLGFFTEKHSGRIRKSVSDDTAQIHTMVAHLPGDGANTAVSLVATLVYLFIVDWRVALTFLIVFGLIIGGLMSLVFADQSELTAQFFEAQATLSAATVEAVDGAKELKNFSTGSGITSRFDTARTRFADLSYAWMAVTAKPMAILGAVVQPGSTMFLILLILTPFYLSGNLAVSSGLAFLLLGVSAPNGLLTLISMAHLIYAGQQSASNTLEILNAPELTAPAEPSSEVKPAAPAIYFENVSFGYADNLVLENISLEIPAGKVTALVGPSGGGKTTVARLIARFWDVTSGRILIDGHDVRDVPTPWLLKQLAIVFQDVALTSDTIAENIALGHPEVSAEQIQTAAEAALIHDRIIQLPNGYQTQIGAEDGFLSGGELQRLTLARAFLANAPILILDEATAQSDPHSQLEIQRALSQLGRTRTTVVIAHRLATIQTADKIVVIDDGRIIETGSHSELLTTNGRYAELWAAQAFSATESSHA